MLNKIIVICTTLFAVSISAHANSLSELNRCATINDSLERLVCYDELAKTINQGKAPLKVVKKTTVEANKPLQVVKKSAEDNFGQEHLDKEQQAPVQNVTLTIASLEKINKRAWLITFTNGQKWKQTDSEALRLKEGLDVQLVRGALGSIYLKKQNANKRIRVRRIK